ncbi:MAG: hypothetical protein IT441_07090 [Phycisphaeraceae bacterium]|nr:hypothetical protein [Phycisphaeraceae bacterium]
MPAGQDYSAYQRKVINRYYEHRDTLMTQKLGELVSELYVTTSAGQSAKLWKSVKTALANTQADPARVTKILATGDITALAQLVNELAAQKPVPATKSSTPVTPAGAAPASPPAPSPADTPAQPVATAPGEPTEQDLKMAFGAFKKRLKLTRLDEESKLRRHPTTGRSESVTAITPPSQFPKSCWEALVRQGRLKYAGNGMYSLP